MKKSLTFHLVILISSTILVSSLITTVLVNSFTSRSIKGYVMERDRHYAQTMALSLTAALVSDSLDEAILFLNDDPNRANQMPLRGGMMNAQHPRMNAQSRENPEAMSFVITDSEGSVLFTYRIPRLHRESLLSREVLEEAVPYFNEDQSVAGYVLAGSMLGGSLSDQEDQSMRSLLKGILLSALLAALLASLIGSLALQKILKPLKALNKGVRQLSRGDYSFRVEHPRAEDELGQLASGFNEMARSLHEAEQWKKQIISDTAHELRTPVSLIMGNLEMMMEGVYQADEKRLRSLYEESALLAELIKDLQVLSNAEATSAELEKETFFPDELVSFTAEGFRAVGRDKRLDIEVETAYGSLWEGDRRKIQQVLKNLLSNAVRYTPEEGRIVLRTSRFKDSFLLEVEDSGPGIPPDERQRIFDRFYRMDRSRNREDGGSGLGLAISRAIITLHGGSIEALEGRSGGALFRVLLPVSRKS